MSCMWIKDGFYFKFNSGQLSGLDIELPTILLYFKVVGCQLSCPLSCPLYPFMEEVGSLICMAKFQWAAHSAAHWAAHFSIYESSGQLNLHGKIPMGSPLASHSTAYWAAHFFIFWSSGLPTEMPTVSIYGRSGQPKLHCKFPWATHGQPTPLPTCNQWSATWAAPLFFPIWVKPQMRGLLNQRGHHIIRQSGAPHGRFRKYFLIRDVDNFDKITNSCHSKMLTLKNIVHQLN